MASGTVYSSEVDDSLTDTLGNLMIYPAISPYTIAPLAYLAEPTNIALPPLSVVHRSTTSTLVFPAPVDAIQSQALEAVIKVAPWARRIIARALQGRHYSGTLPPATQVQWYFKSRDGSIFNGKWRRCVDGTKLDVISETLSPAMECVMRIQGMTATRGAGIPAINTLHFDGDEAGRARRMILGIPGAREDDPTAWRHFPAMLASFNPTQKAYRFKFRTANGTRNFVMLVTDAASNEGPWAFWLRELFYRTTRPDEEPSYETRVWGHSNANGVAVEFTYDAHSAQRAYWGTLVSDANLRMEMSMIHYAMLRSAKKQYKRLC